MNPGPIITLLALFGVLVQLFRQWRKDEEDEQSVGKEQESRGTTAGTRDEGAAGSSLASSETVSGPPSAKRTSAQRRRDSAHRKAQNRNPSESAELGVEYDLFIEELEYNKSPAEARGRINSLHTFVRGIPSKYSADALSVGDVIRVRVQSYGAKQTSAQAEYLGRAN